QQVKKLLRVHVWRTVVWLAAVVVLACISPLVGLSAATAADVRGVEGETAAREATSREAGAVVVVGAEPSSREASGEGSGSLSHLSTGIPDAQGAIADTIEGWIGARVPFMLQSVAGNELWRPIAF